MRREKIRVLVSSIRVLMVLSSLALLLACAAQPAGNPPADAMHADACTESRDYAAFLAANRGKQQGESIRLTASGYGAPPKKYYPEYQRRLLAMRASRIDAFRALAEIISGMHISGGTTVAEMVVQHDSYRAFIDGFVLGASTVAVKEREDGSYETILEMVVDETFYRAMLAHEQLTACGDVNGRDAVAMQDKDSRANRFYYSE